MVGNRPGHHVVFGGYDFCLSPNEGSRQHGSGTGLCHTSDEGLWLPRPEVLREPWNALKHAVRLQIKYLDVPWYEAGHRSAGPTYHKVDLSSAFAQPTREVDEYSFDTTGFHSRY